jgi:hypothetical protein
MNLVGVEPRLSDLEWRVEQLEEGTGNYWEKGESQGMTYLSPKDLEKPLILGHQDHDPENPVNVIGSEIPLIIAADTTFEGPVHITTDWHVVQETIPPPEWHTAETGIDLTIDTIIHLPEAADIWQLELNGISDTVVFNRKLWRNRLTAETSEFLTVRWLGDHLENYEINADDEYIEYEVVGAENYTMTLKSATHSPVFTDLVVKFTGIPTLDTLTPTNSAIPVKIADLTLAGENLMEMLFKLCDLNKLVNPWL